MMIPNHHSYIPPMRLFLSVQYKMETALMKEQFENILTILA